MKRIVLIACCLLIVLGLCGCQNNITENNVEENNIEDIDTEELVEVEIPNGGFIDGGRVKYSDVDPKKTPLIHEAILLHYERKYEESLLKFLQAIEEGEFDPIMYYFLGNTYNNGLGVKEDYEIAIKYYTKGEECNQPFCTYNLGTVYANVLHDENKAFEQYDKAIEMGEPMAYCRYIQSNLAKDYDLTESYIDKVVNSNDPIAINHAGDVLLKSRHVKYYDKAFELYTIAANFGLADGIRNLGHCYERGDGIERDYKKAYECYMKAAQTYQFSDYYIDVGNCYEKGVGVEKNFDKALEYYELSSKDGNGEGWNNIGYMYEKGSIVEQDYNKALEYYELGYTAKFPSEAALTRHKNLKASIDRKEQSKDIKD